VKNYEYFIAGCAAMVLIQYLPTAGREWKEWRRTRKKRFAVLFAFSLIIIFALGYVVGNAIAKMLQ